MTTTTATRRAPQSKAALAKAMKQKLADMAPQLHEGAVLADQHIALLSGTAGKWLPELRGPSIFEQTVDALYPQRFIQMDALPESLAPHA